MLGMAAQVVGQTVRDDVFGGENRDAGLSPNAVLQEAVVGAAEDDRVHLAQER